MMKRRRSSASDSTGTRRDSSGGRRDGGGGAGGGGGGFVPVGWAPAEFFDDVDDEEVAAGNKAAADAINELFPPLLLRHLYRTTPGSKYQLSFIQKYLGFNEISVVEGLEAQENLEELHLEKQRLAEGEELHFDPRTLDTLAGGLRVLDVSGDGLRTLAGAKRLRALERLRAAGNPLQESESLAAAMDAGAWPCLRELDVRGSPASRERRHRMLVVAAAPVSLHMLDGREVAEVQRNFLRGMQSCHRRASETALPTAVDPEPLLHALAPEVGEMALRLPPAVRRAVSRTLLEETAAAASAFGFGAGAGGGAGGGMALPLPSAPLHPTFPAWRQPQTALRMEGGGDGVCGMGDGGVGVVGVAAPKGRVRAKVPRPFWRHRASTGPRSPPTRTSSTCPLRLPQL